MAVVELENVSKSYGVVEVIENLNLRIEDGSFTVFVGLLAAASPPCCA